MAKDVVTTAIVTVPFSGVPDGQHHPKRFAKGDRIEGELAKVAIAQKWAEEAKGQQKASPKLDLEQKS